MIYKCGRRSTLGVSQCRTGVRAIEEAVDTRIAAVGGVEGLNLLPSAAVDRALDGNAWNGVVARRILPPGNALGAAKGHWLAVLIAQDGPYLPAAHHIGRRSGIEELLTPPERQFINGAPVDDFRDVEGAGSVRQMSVTVSLEEPTSSTIFSVRFWFTSSLNGGSARFLKPPLLTVRL